MAAKEENKTYTKWYALEQTDLDEDTTITSALNSFQEDMDSDLPEVKFHVAGWGNDLLLQVNATRRQHKKVGMFLKCAASVDSDDYDEDSEEDENDDE